MPEARPVLRLGVHAALSVAVAAAVARASSRSVRVGWPHRLGACCLALASLVHGRPTFAAAAPGNEPAALLTQAYAIKTTDHTRFLQLLRQLHQPGVALSPDQHWRLRYLDGWEGSFTGDYTTAQPLLRDVADHAPDTDLQALAAGTLLNILAISHHYQEAFERADKLVANIPRIRDRKVAYVALSQLSQLMASAQQVEPAVSYARQMQQLAEPGQSPCRPDVYLFDALNANGTLPPTAPIFRQAIDACKAAGELMFADAVELDLARRLAETGDPGAALVLLKQIAPTIDAQGFQVHAYGLRSTLGFAYWKSGDAAKAKRWALAALAMDPKGNFDGMSEYVYKVLYEVARQAGDDRAALDYYRHYRDVQARSVSDAQAVAMAYHSVQQQLSAHQLQVAALGKQNGVLELQQALDQKQIETTRLQLLLLTTVLASVGIWLVRTKRSQLRFRRLARRDGLTGILNHQHFLGEADAALRQAEKSSRGACLALIDLDHFKQVNDNYGHAIGDAVIVRMVTLCQEHLRSVDIFGRLGGEEFGLLLPDCPLEQGLELLDRIRLALADTPIDDRHPELGISASFGVASTRSSGYELSELMAHADAALYRAKRAGRNRVEAVTEGG
ncbi:tetratricopeptide repeat-containing diguanylate cyclase [Dyella ginsengisoli]|uniref:tetratricopeptide repeat-containing diguanylate cyclase n=1 Tax=Dyella ginsengisoli TaxID=363848 RepID=UPI00034D955D|nr:GGDEF domain-containing protein [Dyella ginsengisoli]